MSFLTFTAGQVLTAAQMNTLSKQSRSIVATVDRPGSPDTGQGIFDSTLGYPLTWNGSAWVPDDQLDIFGVAATALVGGANPAASTGRFLVQAGSVVGTIAIAGYSVSYPTPFPNGVVTVLTTGGDNTGGQATWTANHTTSGFTVLFTSAVNGALARCNYLAIGW